MMKGFFWYLEHYVSPELFLYTETRGAHTYWLSKETVDARPDHILNLIHYEVYFFFHFAHKDHEL